MNDRQLRQDILDVFQWDPRIEAAHIGVIVDHGVVTLTGCVGTKDEMIATEEAAQHVNGIRAIRQEIELQASLIVARSDDPAILTFGTD